MITLSLVIFFFLFPLFTCLPLFLFLVESTALFFFIFLSLESCQDGTRLMSRSELSTDELAESFTRCDDSECCPPVWP